MRAAWVAGSMLGLVTSRGELSLVEQLLDAKANVDAKDSVRTPLLSLSRARPCPCCFRR